jgi:hypothetical protein
MNLYFITATALDLPDLHMSYGFRVGLSVCEAQLIAQ